MNKNVKKSLIIKTRNCGFFSSVFQVLDNIEYCSQHDMKPIIELGDEFKYKNLENNSWNEFFCEINDGVIEGEPIEIPQLPNGALYLLDDYVMVSPLHGNFKSVIWENIKNPEAVDKYRRQINNTINKYLKPSSYIQGIVDNFVKKNFKPLMLGVHFRGTDFEYNDIDSFTSMISMLLEQNNYSKLYIASDNQEAIKLLSDIFPNSCFYNTTYRAELINSTLPAFYIFSGEDMIKQGQSVLIESILLSKCDGIICVNSAVAKFSTCLNPEMPIHLVTRLPLQG
jgi:hypothetical protein